MLTASAQPEPVSIVPTNITTSTSDDSSYKPEIIPINNTDEDNKPENGVQETEVTVPRKSKRGRRWATRFEWFQAAYDKAISTALSSSVSVDKISAYFPQLARDNPEGFANAIASLRAKMHQTSLDGFTACCVDRGAEEKINSFERMLYPDPEERLLVAPPELALAAKRIAAKREQLAILQGRNAELQKELDVLAGVFGERQTESASLMSKVDQVKGKIIPASAMEKARIIAAQNPNPLL